MSSEINIVSLQNSLGTTVVNTSQLSPNSRYLRKVVTQVDTALKSTTTGWTLAVTFDTINDFAPGSLIRLAYHIPMRNDSTSWGGGYIEPQITYGTSDWVSLGSSGYDGGVMQLGGAYIGSYHQVILIDPQINTPFSIRLRFYYKSYDGTIQWNNNHALNDISGTATLLTGNEYQHYAHVIVEEYARLN